MCKAEKKAPLIEFREQRDNCSERDRKICIKYLQYRWMMDVEQVDGMDIKMCVNIM